MSADSDAIDRLVAAQKSFALRLADAVAGPGPVVPVVPVQATASKAKTPAGA